MPLIVTEVSAVYHDVVLRKEVECNLLQLCPLAHQI